MAAKFDLGDVGQSGTATGPHAHLYVKDKATGRYLDPRTIRSPLLGLRVGQQEIPAFIKDSSGKIVVNPQSGITITSGYGNRVAPTDKASSFHEGEDLALPAATKLSYVGNGTYTPKPGSGGFGNLGTFVTGDNKYELGFGHMSRLGQTASVVPGANSTASPQSPTYEQSQQRTNDILEAFMKGTQYQAATQPQARPKTASESLKDQLLASLMGGGTNMLQGVTDTGGLPQEYIQAIWG